ncbi:MAG: gamma-glutamylcyclotransferase [Desulfobulbaceae bacterium]|nr:gamma-glutamylcyclotransferase [Desulfobulbaceae bacterium]
MPPVALFAYGTLMLPEVMTLVTGREFRAQEAVLVGFRRYRLRGEVYPGIWPEGGAETTGLLYQGLDRQALDRLDAFEGEQYRRQTVTVKASDGREWRAETYLLDQRWLAALSKEEWEPAWFLANHLEAFVRACEPFRVPQAGKNPA